MGRPKGSKNKTKRTDAQSKSDQRINKVEEALDEGHKCSCCGKWFKGSYISKNFYISFDRRYKGNFQNVINVCKNCIVDDLFIEKYKIVQDTKLTVKMIAQDLGYYWNENIYEGAVKQNKSQGTHIMRCYIQKCNSMKQYKGLTFTDYLMEKPNADSKSLILEKDNLDSKANNIVNDGNSKKLSNRKLNEMQDMFGYGFTDEEYLNFYRKYKKISQGYKEKTSLHTERLIDYITKKVKEEMAIAEGNVAEAAKWETMAKNSAQAAKINISQLSKNDVTGGIDLVPQLVEAVEDCVSLIPVMPKLKEVPYDDADVIIWAINNKVREIDNLPRCDYNEIYEFYNKFLISHYEELGYDKNKIEEEINKRKTTFRDLGEIYYEPTYEMSED